MKHELYGSKVQVLVRPTGMASAFSRLYPRYALDFSNLVDGIDNHLKRMQKRENNDLFYDSFHLHEKYPNQ